MAPLTGAPVATVPLNVVGIAGLVELLLGVLDPPPPPQAVRVAATAAQSVSFAVKCLGGDVLIVRNPENMDDP